MKVHALVTDKVLSGDWEIKHVSYSSEGDTVFVMVTHADTWELNALRRVSWEAFASNHPVASGIAFQEGQHLLTRSSENGAWTEIR